jgi:hypothetical protein
VSYLINSSGTPGTDGEFEAVHGAFNVWEEIPTSKISFTFDGFTGINGSAYDNVNLVTWTDVITGTDMGIAETFAFYSVIDGHFFDVDIILSNFADWSVTGDPDAFDVQSVMTHEVGHLIGLADLYSPLDADKVMYGFIDPGDVSDRILTDDEIAGASDIYPVESESGGGNGGGGGGCFIATAAYGTPLAQEIVYLRYFRDDYLQKTYLGKKIIFFYNFTGPCAAAVIKINPPLRTLTRFFLKPLVYFCKRIWNREKTKKSKANSACVHLNQ